MTPLLDVRNLKTQFHSSLGVVQAVDDVSFSLNEGETLGVVGESGCGKTVLSLSIMWLVPNPPGRIVSGSVLFDGRDILALPEKKMRAIRGRKISMIFQEPMSALNPVFRIGDQIMEVVNRHENTDHSAAFEKACTMLAKVGIPSPEKRMQNYPHQLSGGMRQRVMIAMALICRPSLMLADEPTTALDVTIQAQILSLIEEMKQQFNTAILLITHDLGVIAQSAQRVAVMYAGEIVEHAPVENLFATPRHPYTEGLLSSIPPSGGQSVRESRLKTIPGSVPEYFSTISGCRFRDRCPYAMAICRDEKPALTTDTNSHLVRCWR
jgi:oligopeptide/dipeptide ABC transporter ATP-binding protein